MNEIQNPFTRERALELLTKYNSDPFHLQHALTVEAVMGWFARESGFDAEERFWSNVGLLHDIDFEQFPGEHCVKAAELLREGGANDAFIHAVCSHGWQICTDVRPEHTMEKVLYAADELSGLIGAAALVRPSKSVQDMELKSVKKKFKTPAFAAGCSRDVITNGAALLGWELDMLIEKTLQAMRETETDVNDSLRSVLGVPL
jgi:predicted hydrolase (HD superfamily)